MRGRSAQIQAGPPVHRFVADARGFVLVALDRATASVPGPGGPPRPAARPHAPRGTVVTPQRAFLPPSMRPVRAITPAPVRRSVLMARKTYASLGLVALLASACPGGGGTADADGGASSGATTGPGEPTTTAPGAPTTGTGEPGPTGGSTDGTTTTGEPATTGDVTTGDVTTDSTTDPATGTASSSGDPTLCTPGAQQACYSGPDGTEGIGACAAGLQTCDDDGAAWGPCVGDVTPQPEACETPADDDCDGVAIEAEAGCVCEANAVEACYTGPQGTQGVGVCQAGTRVCDELGVSLGPCEDEVVPGAEDCASAVDEDCDGSTPACAATHLWSRRFGDAMQQSGWKVAVDGAGDVIVVGEFYGEIKIGASSIVSAGLGDVFVVKFKADGSHLWSRRFGDASNQGARDVATDGAGNVFVTGLMRGSVDFGGGPIVGKGGDDIFLVKLDPAGAHLWSRGYGSTEEDAGTSVATDPAGNVLFTGRTWGTLDFGGGPLAGLGANDVFLAKFGPNGGHVWSKRFGDNLLQYAVGMAVDASGVVVTGGMTGTMDFGGGPLVAGNNYDVFVARFTGAGAHVWSKSFGTPAAAQSGIGVALDPDSNVVVVGELNGTADFGGGPLMSAGGSDVFVAKYSAAGAHLWSKRFGGNDTQIPYEVAADPFGNVLLTGILAANMDLGGGPLMSAGSSDIFTAKLDPKGGHVWSRRFGDANPEYGLGVATDAGANVVVVGPCIGVVNFGGGPLPGAGGFDVCLGKFAP